MKRTHFPVLIIISLIFSLAGSIHTTRANSLLPSTRAPDAISSPDLDQDGISNTVENNGWYNLLGGPYMTNALEADSDFDGLTDSDEKLFNTDPTDPQSPGIAVKYESSFKTFEYYNPDDPQYLDIVQGGNQYLLTEGAVIRRGTDFTIAAVNSISATLSINGPGVSNLTPLRDPARGGWTVSAPMVGPVGLYTATITDGIWSKSLPIYVIFELPTDLTTAQIEAYVYDDDPANMRDEVAVWWRAMDYPYYNGDEQPPVATCLITDTGVCSGWQYHTISGFAQAFWTEQFTKKVLIDYTIPAIDGTSNLYDATVAIGNQADRSVRVNYSSVKNSFSSATLYQFYPTDPDHLTTPYRMDGGACETSAGVYTAMLRSAGIASRPFALDYNKTEGHGENGNFGVFEYDTAVMMWLAGPGDLSNRWYAERTFNGAEPEWQSTPEWTSGTTGVRVFTQIGVYDPAHPELEFKKFQDLYSDDIHAANEGWDFQISEGVGMVNTAWTGIDVPGTDFVYQNRDFKWNSKKPLEIQQSPLVDIFNCQLWQGDGWAPSEWYPLADPRYTANPFGRTVTQTYILPIGFPTGPADIENWPFNPMPNSCSWSTSAEACAAFMSSWQATCAAMPGQTFASTPPAVVQPALASTSTLNTSIQLGKILSSTGVDQNGDGRFDQFVVTIELKSSLTGEYQIGGWLLAGDKQIRASTSLVTLTAGYQAVQVIFDGQQIGDNKANGPYQVETIWVAPGDQPVSGLVLPEEMAAYKSYSYASQPYQASAFTVRAASILGKYTHSMTGKSANGRMDVLTVSVPLSIAIPGTFKVEADLFDGQGRFVGHSKWTGKTSSASLEFAIAGTVAPYSLEHLRLTDASGRELQSFFAPVYRIHDLGAKVDLQAVTPGSSPAVSPLFIDTNGTFTATPLDTNANGLYEQITVSTLVTVTGQAGSYWMEGLLVDAYNLPAVWSVSAPAALIVGQNQTLEMTFDGKTIFDNLPLAGNKVFTLLGVKIFSGVPGPAQVLEADIPLTSFTSDAYTRTQFEPSFTDINLFQDDMEAGTANWTVNGTSQWSRATTDWHSPTHAWISDGSNQDGLLTLTTPLTFTNYGDLWLSFKTAYLLSAGQGFTLEVSTNGSTWTPLQTFTGSTAYWTPVVVDLSAYGQRANISLRFNAQSNPGSVWMIDDMYVHASNDYHIHLPFMVRR